MPEHKTRREFLNETAGLAAAAWMGAGLGARALGGVHRGVGDTIHVALVGCGSRGAGAAVNALSVPRGPVRLIAMADCFEDRLTKSHESITTSLNEDPDKKLIDGLQVPQEQRFIGFDGYKHAMDCLRPGDVVILTTPPAFRWVHFTYAIEKGLNVFMEKPLCVDGPTGKRMLELTEKAQKKGLKVAVGLMSRHSRALQELVKRVQDGQLGEIVTQHGYRMQGDIATFRSTPKPEGTTDLEHQIRRFHGFLWASGGGFNDFFIHLIDQMCWMKGALPVKAQAVGGRHYRKRDDGVPYVDQNFDSYGAEYTYADGTVMMFSGRNIVGAQEVFSSHMVGTKGAAIVSASGDCGAPSSIFSRRNMTKDSMVWTSKVPAGETNPYQNEWNDFVDAIRDNKPYNEAKYGIEATLVCGMGRMAAHTGREITFQELLDCKHEFAPGVDKLTKDSPSPLPPGADGLYPVPQPGIVTDREY